MIAKERIGALAVEALLYEVAATPKPGLVDRNNAGAHADMDFFTFMSSAAALRGYFDTCAEIGIKAFRQTKPVFLPDLQKVGLKAEADMFAMTGGVNTHKGMIFSLGILAACFGYLTSQGKAVSAQDVCQAAGVLCKGLCAAAYHNLQDKPEQQLTKGEKMYRRYGVTGVRGEAEAGFPSLCRLSLPHYRKCRAANMSINDSLVDTLLVLLTDTHDTNILGRHDWQKLQRVQSLARDALHLGGMRTEAGRRTVLAMDETFIKEWISPGGAADLLAATHFLYACEQNNRL